MAFGIKRTELTSWKKAVSRGEIAIITHYWQDARFLGCTSVTKVGCSDIQKLIKWGESYQLKAEWIHISQFPHFDLFGEKQHEILVKEGKKEQLKRFVKMK